MNIKLVNSFFFLFKKYTAKINFTSDSEKCDTLRLRDTNLEKSWILCSHSKIVGMYFFLEREPENQQEFNCLSS